MSRAAQRRLAEVLPEEYLELVQARGGRLPARTFQERSIARAAQQELADRHPLVIQTITLRLAGGPAPWRPRR